MPEYHDYDEDCNKNYTEDYNEKEEKYYAVLFINNTGIVLSYHEGIKILNALKFAKRVSGYGLHNIGDIEDFKIGDITFTIVSEKQYLERKIENLVTNE